MTDIFFPPDIPIAAMFFGIDDFTAVDESATTGGMQSSALYGTRRWRLRMDFQTLSRSNGSLARFESLVAALRGRANRVWIGLAQQKLRGSFPATELFTNNDFSSGAVSPWLQNGEDALSILDHGMRATRVEIVQNAAVFQAITKSVGIAYCLRGFINAGTGQRLVNAADFTESVVFGTAISQGMIEASYTVGTPGSGNVGFEDLNGGIAGYSYDFKWTSFSRCAQVDNGTNLALNSDTPGTGTGWALNAATAATSGLAAPDGGLNAWKISETAVSSAHFASQPIAIPTGGIDFSFSVFVNQGASARGFAWIQMTEATGGTITNAWINLSTGAVTNVSTGANWTAISALSVNYGNGWWRFILTARKTNAATSITVFVGPATSAGVNGYLGATSAFILAWRASFARSSVPTQAVQTATTAQAGTLQTGFTLNLKGLPVSTQGLLLEGDVVECLMPTNSQLLRVVSRLDSDAAGLGTLIFENALKQSPADGAGVVVQQPMGRFVLAASTLGIEYTPGVFGQASLEFVEAA